MMKELSTGRESHFVGDQIVEELKSLAEKNDGLLVPEKVVEAARHPQSPMHHRFEWDDGEAAAKYRLFQARLLINVSVQYIDDGKKTSPTKVFVSLSTDRGKGSGGGYRQFVDVMADSDLKNQLMLDALEAMTHFQERYKQLERLSDVFSAMDRIKREIPRKNKKAGDRT